MNTFIVDASVAAKWFLDEDLSVEARRVLLDGNSLHAPDFLLLEMDSVFLKRIRRGDITPGDAEAARSMLRQVPMARHAFPTLLDPAFVIANQTGQSVYDSLYVALAIGLDSRVITADRRLHDGLVNGPFKKHVVWVGDI